MMSVPVALAVSSLVFPRFPQGGTTRPEWPVPAPASPQTHVSPSDIPDGPAPALWPYRLHSAKQVEEIGGKKSYICSITAIVDICKNNSMTTGFNFLKLND